jgi:hypothetical protein
MASRLEVTRPPLPMSATERATLLKRLEELPPDLSTPTPDQRQYFRACKQLMLMLREEFRTYFSGERSYSSTFADEREQSYFRSLRNRWLWLYNLLFDHYDLVEAQAEQLGFKIPDKPGDYLIACLEEYSIAAFWSATFEATEAQSTFSPSISYKLYQQINRLRPLFEKEQKSLTASERIKLHQCLEKHRAYEVPTEIILLWRFSEGVFKSHAKGDKNVKKLWKQYELAWDEVECEAARFIHPQNGRPGCRWQDGVRLQM